MKPHFLKVIDFDNGSPHIINTRNIVDIKGNLGDEFCTLLIDAGDYHYYLKTRELYGEIVRLINDYII